MNMNKWEEFKTKLMTNIAYIDAVSEFLKLKGGDGPVAEAFAAQQLIKGMIALNKTIHELNDTMLNNMMSGDWT